MNFTRTKKLTFFNNKGGVGKTTLAYNCAVEFARKGYKTVLIDLDPQTNLTRLALGDEYYANTLFSSGAKDVSDVLSGVVRGGSDIDISFKFEQARQGDGNLHLLPGSLKLSDYESLLTTAYNSAAAGDQIGYFQTSAVNRYLYEKGLDEQVDIFIIDTSPNMNLLNRVILLGTDYFVVPMNPDAFSLQGIENLGVKLEEWKRNWRDTGKALSKSKGIESQFVLDGEGLFIGYILNSYNVCGKQPIKDHRKWIEQIPGVVKEYLSDRHSKNGLVAASYAASLHNIQDYGRIPAICHETGDAVFTIDPAKVEANQLGTTLDIMKNIEKAKEEFDELSDNILKILEKY